MKNEDEEAFAKFMGESLPFSYYEHYSCPYIEAWQAACEYMQAKLAHHIFKIEAENAKLRECVEFYAEPWERGELDGELLVRKLESYDSFVEVHYKARQVLKELDEKL